MPSVFKKVCEKCGSEYTITKIKIPVRDDDKIECEICGTELLSWNGGVMYRHQLDKRGEWPKKTTNHNSMK
jgi:ribosomal protein S27E